MNDFIADGIVENLVFSVSEIHCIGVFSQKELMWNSSVNKQESPANAKGTRDSSACMKAHCYQM